MIDQKTIKALSKSSGYQKILKYLAESVVSIDKVSDIDTNKPIEVAVEVKARKLATKKLTEILSALVVHKSGTGGFNPKEYITDYQFPEKKK